MLLFFFCGLRGLAQSIMGAKQTKEDETPTSPKSPRVSPVDIASGGETPVPALVALLDKEASRGEEAPSPKSEASVTSRDADAASSSGESVSSYASSYATSSGESVSSYASSYATETTNESHAAARTLVLKGHTNQVQCLAALDGGRLASGSANSLVPTRMLPDYEARAWDRSRGVWIENARLTRMITDALDDLKKDKADDPNRLNYTINAVEAIVENRSQRMERRIESLETELAATRKELSEMMALLQRLVAKADA